MKDRVAMLVELQAVKVCWQKRKNPPLAQDDKVDK